MKKFWKINYYITTYLTIINLFIIRYYIENGDAFYANTKWFQTIERILTFDNTLNFLSLFIEWIQIPICLLVLIFWKLQRTKKHFFYLILLVILNLIKWGLWLFAVSGVARNTGLK